MTTDAKDTSKKIRAVFKSKGQSGKPLCTNPPYGYIKDPEDKTRWIVDVEAAKVVREAFHLCMQGYGPSQIAKEFTRRRIMNPTAHVRKNGINIPDNRGHDDDYVWRGSTIVHMLSRQEYFGNTVNFKTYRKSYKQKKQMKNDPSEWMIFKNTHEAIKGGDFFACFLPGRLRFKKATAIRHGLTHFMQSHSFFEKGNL